MESRGEVAAMKLTVVHADITTLNVDAIVNAANRSLLGGGGVDGAIHRAAGPELLEACRAFNGCATGDAVITLGFKLPCRYVIHTPGPIWRGGTQNEALQLRNCYLNSLRRAAEHDCRTVAFPAISTGVYGYPRREAAGIAVAAVRESPEKKNLDEVIFCCFSEADAAIYRELLG